MVFMEEKVNNKGPDSHQCSLVGSPGTIEAGAPPERGFGTKSYFGTTINIRKLLGLRS